MNGHIFYSAGHTDALDYAVNMLQQKGCQFAAAPVGAVTDLLLGVPCQQTDADLQKLLTQLPKNITVFGGNLQHPCLNGYKTADLLRDPVYLSENAYITAHCAMNLAGAKLPVTWKGCHVLVIGWGRIGKCLAHMLKKAGAVVTVAARKEADRAMLLALGYDTADIAGLDYSLLRYRVIFNTVPVTVLPEEAVQYCREDCLKIDLASVLGIVGDDVIWARGLPNKSAPESSGTLIANTVLRMLVKGV